VHEFVGEESRASGSAGCGGGYVLAGAESRGKAAVAAKAVMLGGWVVVVRVEGFGVEDDVGGSEDALVTHTAEDVVGVGGAEHVAGGWRWYWWRQQGREQGRHW